ncbi:MAG: Ig-like domain-containing protein [Verrucomicrobiota bacterium]
MKSRSCFALFCLSWALLTSIGLRSSLGAEARGLPNIPGLPGDFDFPVLLTSVPFTGQSQVAVDTAVTFTFLTAMAPMQTITWSDNVVAANFSYAWSSDGKTLTCTYSGKLPTNATISWTLEPAGFKSQSGAELLPVNNTGSFTTGSGSTDPNDPCSGSTNLLTGVINVSKSVYYIQDSAAAPRLDPDLTAVFSVSVTGPTANPVSEASVQLPNGTTQTITNLFGHFSLFAEFANEAEMDAAYPSGNYKVTVKLASGTKTVTVTLPSTAPPTPTVANYAATQAFDATADFNLQWLPFTGVATHDSLFLSIFEPGGKSFSAPDICVPRELANTATSIVIPKNTFGVGSDKDGNLYFSKIGGFGYEFDCRLWAPTPPTANQPSSLYALPVNPETNHLNSSTSSASKTVSRYLDVKAKLGAVTVEGSTDLIDGTSVTVGTGSHRFIDRARSRRCRSAATLLPRLIKRGLTALT